MNRYHIRSWLFAYGSIVLLALVSACAGGSDRKSDAYAQEAWAYFKKLCNERSGERIYKTYRDVRSVLVVRPLSPASEKDLFDQFWYGDPYSNATPWEMRGQSAARRLAADSRRPSGPQRGLDFVEIRYEVAGEVRYERISRPPSSNLPASVENIDRPVSRFGVSWEDISTPDDRKYWVAGSRLRVIDFADNSVVGERIGYLIEAGFGSKVGQRRPWLASRGPGTTCPPVLGDYADQQFVTKVVAPEGGK